MTAPFSVEKGIRQDCPLSGLLYSIAIEPFLNRLRGEVGDDGLWLPGANVSCSVSAYADDVSVFVTSKRGFGAVGDTYDLFARASTARLNTRKNRGCGPRRVAIFFSQTGLPLQKFQPISLLVTSKALSINNQSSQGKHMFKGGATGTVSNATQQQFKSPRKKSPHFVTIGKIDSKRSRHMSCMCLQ